MCRVSLCPRTPISQPQRRKIEECGHRPRVRPALRPRQRKRVAQRFTIDTHRDHAVGAAAGDILAGDADGDAFGGQSDERQWIVGFEADLRFDAVRAEGAIDDQPGCLLGRSEDQPLTGQLVKADARLRGQAMMG